VNILSAVSSALLVLSGQTPTSLQIDPADLADMQCIIVLLEQRGTLTREQAPPMMAQTHYFMGRLDARAPIYWGLPFLAYRRGLSPDERKALADEHRQRCVIESFRPLPLLREIMDETADPATGD
jgi:hypothetical protein